MGNDFIEEHRGAPQESRAVPFRKAPGLRGRPDSKMKWYLIWARRFAAHLADRPIHLATHEDAEGFLTTLASFPRIFGWQVEQATDALTILLGSLFGQAWTRTIRIPVLPPPPDVPLPKREEPADRLRYAIRCRRYPIRTEESCVFWVNRFLAFCRDADGGQDAGSVRAFLEHLVVSERMSASTQGLALNALVFHFKHVIEAQFGDLGEFQRSKRPRKLPVVLSREEVRRLLDAVDDMHRLPGALLYGGGMRLMKAIRLRVKDIDLDRRPFCRNPNAPCPGPGTRIRRYDLLARPRTQIPRRGHPHGAGTPRAQRRLDDDDLPHVLNRPGLAVRSPEDG